MTGLKARRGLAAAVFGLAALAGAGAQAQPKAEGRAALLQNLLDCRKVADDQARLACFDAQAGAIDQAEAKGDIVVVDREQVRTVRRQAFGFTLPSMSMFERGEDPEEVGSVSLKIESARRQGDGKWLFVLEGGQVWRQIDTTELTRTPKPGGTANIKRAMMGSYKLNIGGATAIRVHRDD